MVLNRRSFLTSVAGLVAVGLTDPEELIWTKKKTIFVPPVPKFMCGLDIGRDGSAYVTYWVDRDGVLCCVGEGNIGLPQRMVDATNEAIRHVNDTIKHHGEEIEAQYRKGRLGDNVNFDWFSSYLHSEVNPSR